MGHLKITTDMQGLIVRVEDSETHVPITGIDAVKIVNDAQARAPFFHTRVELVLWNAEVYVLPGDAFQKIVEGEAATKGDQS